MRDCVNVMLKKNEVIIKIDKEAEQKKIMSSLKKKIPELKKLYKDDKTPIIIDGKILSQLEKEEIKKLINSEIDVAIGFTSDKLLGLYGIKEAFSKKISDSKTKFHKGSLRSGQKIEYEGRVVILGDVNDGAEVIAEDNVIVLGTLRGLAHAGAKGNKEAIIAANSIECMQVRIANIVREMEKSERNILKKYAYVKDEKIIID